MEKSKDSHEATLILDGIKQAMAYIDFNVDGTILGANENFLGVLGYTVNEVVGQHHRMFMPTQETSKPEYKKFWADLAAGRAQVGEFARVRKDGEPVFIYASYTPVKNAQGEVVRVVKLAIDRSEEKRKDIDYEGQLSAISKSQAVIEFNMDGTVLTANKNFCGALG